jgi:hypothetical protein
VDAYYRDKLSATTQPGASVTVASGDDERLLARRALLGPAAAFLAARGAMAMAHHRLTAWGAFRSG